MTFKFLGTNDIFLETRHLSTDRNGLTADNIIWLSKFEALLWIAYC